MAPRRTSFPVLAGSVTCCLAFVVSACAPATSSTGTKGYISGTGAITMFDPTKRSVAPEITGTDLSGKPIAIRSDGSVTVINVWASWCGPCRAEADDLTLAARKLRDVRFFGIDIRDVRSSAAAFVRNFAVPYRSLFDPDGTSVLALHDLATIQSPPTTLVVDRRGRLAAVVSGELTAGTLVGLVHDVSRTT